MVSEYSVVIPFHNFRLMAKYDLLITYSGNPSQTSTIIDWKTSHKRPRRRSQEQRLQTSVYPFVYHQARLASNPETPLQMLYWYTNYPDNPEVFDHTPEQHASTHQLLTTLIDLVSKPSTQNATVEQVYPLTVDENHCRYCVYRSLCNRGVAAGAFTAEGSLEVWDDSESGESDSIILSLEDISEIEF
jgi:hypothetical protein